MNSKALVLALALLGAFTGLAVCGQPPPKSDPMLQYLTEDELELIESRTQPGVEPTPAPREAAVAVTPIPTAAAATTPVAAVETTAAAVAPSPLTSPEKAPTRAAPTVEEAEYRLSRREAEARAESIRAAEALAMTSKQPLTTESVVTTTREEALKRETPVVRTVQSENTVSKPRPSPVEAPRIQTPVVRTEEPETTAPEQPRFPERWVKPEAKKTGEPIAGEPAPAIMEPDQAEARPGSVAVVAPVTIKPEATEEPVASTVASGSRAKSRQQSIKEALRLMNQLEKEIPQPER